MNKMVVVGAILIILGLGGVGISFISTTHTETYKETVPVEEEVTKMRNVPVETQVPKLREVQKQKTVTEKQNVPVFKENVNETVKFNLQLDPGFEQWALVDYKFKSKDPVKFIIKQLATSQKGERYWYITFDGISTNAASGVKWYTSFLSYYHEYPEAYLCYYKNWGDENCSKTENLAPNEGIIIFDPQKLDNEEMLSRFDSQDTVQVKLFFSILEYKQSKWTGIPLKSEDANKIPYLEVHLFDRYETKETQKTVTYTETETYYVTETVTKQETYTEKVTTQKEIEKTHEVKEKPYAAALWLGIVLFIAGAVLAVVGFTKKDVVKEITPQPKKFCSQCGKENLADSAFCINCGASLK